MNVRTTFERATAGYDHDFERALVDVIGTAIAEASLTTDRKVLALRTTETVAALTCCLAATLSLNPDMDVPSRLREAVDQIAKRIRRQVAQARAEGVGDHLGAGKGGHA